MNKRNFKYKFSLNTKERLSFHTGFYFISK